MSPTVGVLILFRQVTWSFQITHGCFARKGKLILSLPEGDWQSLNADEPRVMKFREKQKRPVLSYGSTKRRMFVGRMWHFFAIPSHCQSGRVSSWNIREKHSGSSAEYYCGASYFRGARGGGWHIFQMNPLGGGSTSNFRCFRGMRGYSKVCISHIVDDTWHSVAKIAAGGGQDIGKSRKDCVEPWRLAICWSLARILIRRIRRWRDMDLIMTFVQYSLLGDVCFLRRRNSEHAGTFLDRLYIGFRSESPGKQLAAFCVRG